jgi:hypothetical protein
MVINESDQPEPEPTPVESAFLKEWTRQFRMLSSAEQVAITRAPLGPAADALELSVLATLNHEVTHGAGG